MRLKLIIGLILLLPFFGFSQGEFNNWHFGNKAGITFNSGSPVALSDGQMVVKRGSVCVSDSLGNLLFYSDGDRVWNRNHQVMPNGTGLQAGRESDQTISVIQKIEDDSSYYIFTMKCIYLPITSYGGLHYSVVNMRLDGGLGDIEPGQKEIALQTMNDFPELMTTVRHGNNRDAWVIVRNMFNANNFAAFLVTAAGISTTPVISQSSLAWNPIPYGNAGTMRVSPDGAKLVYPHMDTIEFCNFNATTGQITPQFLIRPGTYLESAPWGYLEFSLDSRYLYCSTGDWPWSPSNIYQYDASWTDSTRFKESEMLVGYRNTGVHLQRGPDGKIYGGEAGKDSLSVIHNPALPGIACNYQPHAIFLQGRQCYEGMPDLLQRYYVYIGHSGNCRWNPVQFNPIVWPPADSVYWDFGDPGSGTSNFSNVIHALHTYSSPGVYPVHLFVRHNDKRTDTTSMSLTINPGVDVNVGPNREICLGDSVTFNAVGCSGCTFQWSNLTTGQINIGNTQTLKTGTAGIYLIEATGANGCIDQDTVQLVTDSVPQVMNGELSKTICSGDTTKIALISNVSGTIFHWLATLTSGAVTGFSADSGEVINQTLVNTGSIAGVVTYQITPKVGECWGAQVDFPVTVNVGDSVKVSIIASVNNICEGAPVIFTATPTNPGSNPVFQWKVHSLNAGINSPALTYIPANGDVVQCILTSSNTVCTSNNPATSNSITMVVNPLQLVSVSISPSANPVCSGTSVTFTAFATNGGTIPGYQWKVNGTNEGTNNPVFSFSPVNGDVVTCSLSSSETCASGNPAPSNPITMLVNANLPAGITIAASANPFCPGLAVTFTATPSNGGTMPMYQWKVNSILSTPSILPIYTYSPNNNDTVNCIMTSNLSCVTGNPVSSAKIIMSGTLAPIVRFASCFDTVTTVNAKPFKLKGGLPLGGTYSGSGVNSITGTFTPSVAGTGLKTINYSYTNVAACNANKSKTILVLANPPFICGNTLNDIRDGKSYPTVLIGTQCWMSSNLDFGFPISDSTPQTDNCTPEKYLRPSSFVPRPSSFVPRPSSLVPRPSFYQWDELMRYQTAEGSQGLCPPGWHVPTETEWSTLFDFYQGASKAGRPLQDSIINGFKALRSGIFYLNSSWSFPDFATIFWSSTSAGQTKAISHGMNLYNFSVSLYPASRGNAFAARCLLD